MCLRYDEHVTEAILAADDSNDLSTVIRTAAQADTMGQLTVAAVHAPRDILRGDLVVT